MEKRWKREPSTYLIRERYNIFSHRYASIPEVNNEIAYRTINRLMYSLIYQSSI